MHVSIRVCLAAAASASGVVGPALALGPPPAATPAATPAAPAPAASEIDARYANARKLSRSDHPEQAVAEYAWLWENALKVDPSKAELRTSFIASEMEWLVSRVPEAKPRFAALRDATEARLKAASTLDPLLVDDYLILNRVVGEPERTLAWFDGVKSDPALRPEFPRLSQRVEQLLEANSRWVDLSTYFYPRPAELAQQAADANHAAVQAAMHADPGKREMLNVTQERSYNARVSRIYAALLAAKRDAEAERVLEIVASGDTFGRAVLACITKGLDINEPRASMRAPLDAAWKKGAGIKLARERLNKALK